jgi:hypothetical protein
MEDAKVAVTLEDLRSQFRVFGEGLQILNEKVDQIDTKVDALDQRLERHEIKNEEENRLLMQKIGELSEEQQKLKRAK